MKTRLRQTLLCVVLGSLAIVPHAMSNPFQFGASADSFVDGLAADVGNNYGSAGALGIAPSGANKGEFDSFISFNLSTLNTNFGAGNWTADTFTLTLTATAPNNAIFNGFQAGPGSTNINTAGLFTVNWISNTSWVEGTGTPTAPDTNSAHIDFTDHTNYLSGVGGNLEESLGTFSFNGGTSGSQTYTLTPTSDFISAVEAGGTVSLYLDAADTSINYLFVSKNNSPTNGPQLNFNAQAAPEPGSAAALVSGMGLLCALRRRGVRG